MWDVITPADLDAAARHVRPEDLRNVIRVSADLGRHAAWLHEDRELGLDAVYLHEVGKEQVRFVDTFAADVLPRLA
jgi:coenzyme F420-dependent glucose-6-phosphate dehydrogenase